MAKSKKTKVTVERPSTKTAKVIPPKEADRTTQSPSLMDRLQGDLRKNQSYLNYVLGALIVLIVGILLFNYFNKPNNLGPSQQANQQEHQTEKNQPDVTKDKLPGKYTVKEGDTLFLIAQNYYNDGYKYTEIIEENKLENPDVVEVGKVLTIPKLEGEQTAEAPNPSPSPEPTTTPQPQADNGQGGAENATIWGDRITADTYTVQAGDWLSKIAGRAYGDINQYAKLAEANNITNPEVIEVGTVLKIPR